MSSEMTFKTKTDSIKQTMKKHQAQMSPNTTVKIIISHTSLLQISSIILKLKNELINAKKKKKSDPQYNL